MFLWRRQRSQFLYSSLKGRPDIVQGWVPHCCCVNSFFFWNYSWFNPSPPPLVWSGEPFPDPTSTLFSRGPKGSAVYLGTAGGVESPHSLLINH